MMVPSPVKNSTFKRSRTSIEKQKQIAVLNLLAQFFLDDADQTWKTLPHVRRGQRREHLDLRRHNQHSCASRNARSRSTSARRSMPPGTSIDTRLRQQDPHGNPSDGPIRSAPAAADRPRRLPCQSHGRFEPSLPVPLSKLPSPGVEAGRRYRFLSTKLATFKPLSSCR